MDANTILPGPRLRELVQILEDDGLVPGPQDLTDIRTALIELAEKRGEKP